jgi:uncharacterized Zn finger protein
MSFYWKPYVSVAQRREKAKKVMAQLIKKGRRIQPVELEGRTIARSFWGKSWCLHLESFSDYDNRLPRGRTYVRNGSVCHLEIKAGLIEAMVSGSELYQIKIVITPLKDSIWKTVVDKCRGQIGSMLELLQGRLSDRVMGIVSDRQDGLFPQPGEMKLTCSCPDWANMCKHVAAVLYGVGNRLDTQPELLFLLRGVDAAELIAAEVNLPAMETSGEQTLAEAGLAGIFGIELADAPDGPAAAAVAAPAPARQQSPQTRRMAAPSAQLAPAAHAVAVAKSAAAPPDDAAEVFTGAAIAQLRKQAGLTLGQFALELGVSLASVGRWESIAGPVGMFARSRRALTAMRKKLAAGQKIKVSARRRRPA